MEDRRNNIWCKTLFSEVMNMNKLRLSLMGAGLLGIAQLVNGHQEVHYRASEEEMEVIQPGILLNQFTSKEYKVSFKYPKGWVENPRYEDKYEGKDGFFEVGAFAGVGETIDEAVKMQIDEPYKPYGNNPVVRSFTADGQPARVIYPSDDQSDFYKDRDTAIVVQYPEPIKIDDKIFDFVVIWTLKEYVPLILSTFKFV